MTYISAFSFCHNALEGGYPIIEAIKSVQHYVDEIVVVDMQSDDGTRKLLEQLKVRIIPGVWREGGQGYVDCLNDAHALNVECKGSVIIHFEADEVYDQTLISNISHAIHYKKLKHLAVSRIQICQNFQRIRWYPCPVHRVFTLGSVTKAGHTTKEDLDGASNILKWDQDQGLLWDVTFNFRDNLRKRVANSQYLYGEDRPGYKFVPDHFAKKWDLDETEFEELLLQVHWEYHDTFINIPEVLKPLLGVTDYQRYTEEKYGIM